MGFCPRSIKAVMNGLWVMPLVTLILCACSTPQPRLTQDARLEFDPNRLPAGATYSKVTPDEWAKHAAEICARPDFQCTQAPIEVSLQKPDGSMYHMTLTPPIMTIQNGGNIYILAGQTLNVEADIVDGKLTNMHLVDKVVRPEKTIIVNLEQASNPTRTLNMLLSVRNPFDKPLKYSAGMMVLDGPDGAVYATDTCPVLSKLLGVENWPMPIFQLILTNFHTLEPSDKATCDY